MSRRIEYRVDLFERGEYAATVYDGDVVLLSIDTVELEYLHEFYGVKHGFDKAGLREYLTEVGVLDPSDTFDFYG